MITKYCLEVTKICNSLYKDLPPEHKIKRNGTTEPSLCPRGEMMKTRYVNLNDVSNKKTFRDIRKWQKERRSKEKDLTENIPQCSNKRIKEIKENRSRTSYTWIGHSTFCFNLMDLIYLLIQYGRSEWVFKSD